MKPALAALLFFVFPVFAAPPHVMTNQTIEAMVYGGVPLATIVTTIKTASRIQLSETKQDYNRLIAAGISAAAATEIMKAIHYRQFVGIDNRPPQLVAPPIQTAPTSAPKVLEVPLDAKSQPRHVTPPVPAPGVPPAATLVPPVPVLARTGELNPETAAAITARKPSAAGREEEEEAPPVREIGVYYESGEGWTAIPPEMVKWKTGVTLKSLGTLGVLKGDVNGELRNWSSKTRLGADVQLLVFAPKGVAVDDYQLFRLHAQSDSREFRAVTGRISHVSGGEERDTVAFEGIPIAPRTWTINLGSLPRGEYGLLLTRMSGSLTASAELGKMYTFSTSD
jgi:hypothetical protein